MKVFNKISSEFKLHWNTKYGDLFAQKPSASGRLCPGSLTHSRGELVRCTPCTQQGENPQIRCTQRQKPKSAPMTWSQSNCLPVSLRVTKFEKNSQFFDWNRADVELCINKATEFRRPATFWHSHSAYKISSLLRGSTDCRLQSDKQLEEGHSIEVQTHAGHLISPSIFLHFVTLWRPLTFWPNINSWTRISDGLSNWQVWWLSFQLFWFYRVDRQTNRITHRETPLNASLQRLYRRRE